MRHYSIKELHGFGKAETWDRYPVVAPLNTLTQKETKMKYIVIAIAALALTACKENQGVHKGTFEKDCLAKGGTIAQTQPNEYSCTLPDGSVVNSTDKKDK